MWDELHSRRNLLPLYAGRTVNAARALVVFTPGRPPRMAGLQCMRVFFNEEGRAAKWHLSAVLITPPCELGPGASPEPIHDKHRKDPLFWFPARQELKAIAKALTSACGPITDKSLRNVAQQGFPSSPPPLTVRALPTPLHR